MKKLDIILGTLLVIGGLNWGLVGLFNVNLISVIFGEMSFLSRLIYILIGVAAVYDIVMIKAIWQRWDIHLGTPKHV